MKSAIITFAFLLIKVHNFDAQAIKNGDFENWSLVGADTVESLDNWVTSNTICESLGLPNNAIYTTDARSGTVALKLETTADINGFPFTALAIYSNFLDEYPLKMKGFYKADLRGDDYSSIRVSILSDRGVIGWGVFNIKKSTYVFTPFEIPIDYFVSQTKPDSFSISIYSSLDKAMAGTVLIVDGLNFEIKQNVDIPLTEPFTSRILPNPAIDEILVELPKNIGMVNIRIYDETGRTLKYEVFEDQIKIDVSLFTQGAFIYEIRRADHTFYDQGQFRVTRPRL